MWVLTETGFCEAQQIALQILGNSPPVGVDSALSKRDVKLREPEFNSISTTDYSSLELRENRFSG